MLQAIRSKAGSVAVKGLFGLLIVTFGIWGIGDIFRNRGNPDTVVATVGGQSIDANALQTAVQPALERLSTQFGSAVDLRQAKQMGVIDDVLGQLVDRSLLDQEAARLQLAISDDVVRAAILADPAFKGANGVFDRGAFNELLAANKMTEPQYVERLRQQIPRQDLLLAVTAGVRAPPPVIERIYRYRNENRIADIVALPITGAGDVGQPTEASLPGFTTPIGTCSARPNIAGSRWRASTPSDIAAKIRSPTPS